MSVVIPGALADHLTGLTEDLGLRWDVLTGDDGEWWAYARRAADENDVARFSLGEDPRHTFGRVAAEARAWCGELALARRWHSQLTEAGVQ